MTAEQKKATAVRRMFDRIAPVYDFMNTVLSGGMHHLWRQAAARQVLVDDPYLVVDLACGTGDLAIAVMQEATAPCHILAVDFAAEMVKLARCKLTARDLRFPIELVQGDALALPFPDRSVDAIANAFLLRNVTDLTGALAEFYRVLRPGGRLVTLEITHPPVAGVRQLFQLYFNHVVPLLGTLLVRERAAYTYLPHSLHSYPTAPQLAGRLRHAGFSQVSYTYVGLGTVAIHTGIRER